MNKLIMKMTNLEEFREKVKKMKMMTLISAGKTQMKMMCKGSTTETLLMKITDSRSHILIPITIQLESLKTIWLVQEIKIQHSLSSQTRSKEIFT